MLISVVIPAHNRPDFLLEACSSIAQQTYQNWEVVIIDDGSTPPIKDDLLKEILGNKFKIFRNEHPQGIPKAKNIGIKNTEGEIIFILDDDDLLTSDALETIYSAYKKHPELDCLFLGVEPFGKYAKDPSSSREKSITKILENLKPIEKDNLYFFDERLFDELLNSVPIDFQRPAARRGTWNIVGGYNENCLFSEFNWAIKAATFCKVALTNKPINKWRIHDNNFGWISELDTERNILRKYENGILSGSDLLDDFLEKEKKITKHLKKIRQYHSSQFFNKAYFLRDRNKADGLKSLFRSFFLNPTIKHYRLLISYIIPKSLINFLKK